LVSGNDSRERERGSGAMGAQTPPPPGISDIYSFQGFIGLPPTSRVLYDPSSRVLLL